MTVGSSAEARRCSPPATRWARVHGHGPPAPTAPLSNNGYYGSPGSDHSGGANYGMGDGSVRFMSSSVNGNIFCLLGSMADRVPVMPPD